MSVNFHLSGEREAFARGRELGSRLRPQIASTYADYLWLFSAAGLDLATVREVAESCQVALESWSPVLAREVTGIAAGAGLETWQVAALNARTEIVVRGKVAGLKECSSAVWLPPVGPGHTFQTWDWIPAVDNFTVRRHTSEAGLQVVVFAENGVLAKLGVNSAGLGLLLTLLFHTSDGTRPYGVPVHAVARQVLDTAQSVDEAVDIARSASLTASVAMTLVQHDGRGSTGVTLEMSPAGVAELQPEAGYLLHTNHFLDPDLALGDRLALIGDDTLPRLARLQELREALLSADRTAMARGLVSHWVDGAPICAHPRPDADETDRWETKMMFSLDLAQPALWLHEGGPCQVSDRGWKVVAA